jgi:hypothetical protein
LNRLWNGEAAAGTTGFWKRGITPLQEKDASPSGVRTESTEEHPASTGQERGGLEGFPWNLLILLLLALLLLAAYLSAPKREEAPARAPLWQAFSPDATAQAWELGRRKAVEEENRVAAGSFTRASMATPERRVVFPALPAEVPEGRKIAWRVATPLPRPVTPATAFYHRGTVYVADPHGTLCASRVRTDGSLTPWGVRMGRLPEGKRFAGVVALKDCLAALVDGCLHTATLEPTGVGDWKAVAQWEEVQGPVTLASRGNCLYLIGGGGQSGRIPTVRSVELGRHGHPRGLRAHAPFPAMIENFSAVATEKSLCVVGGESGSGASARVFVARLDSQGNPGDWTPGPSLPAACKRPVLQYWQGAIWAVVATGRTGKARVFRAEVGREGNLKDWTLEGDNLPERVEDGSLLHAGGRFFLLGGKHRETGYPLTEVVAWAPGV